MSRLFLQQIGENIHTSLIFNPKLSELELLQGIVEDFGISRLPKNGKSILMRSTGFFLKKRQGFNAVLIIDEASSYRRKPRTDPFALQS